MTSGTGLYLTNEKSEAVETFRECVKTFKIGTHNVRSAV